MALTSTQALSQLNQCNSLAELRTLVGQVSGKVSGIAADAQHLLYSGGLQNGGGTWTGAIANELANNGTGKFVTVAQSEVGQFLNDRAFTAKLEQLSGFVAGSPEFKALLNGGVDATGTRIPNGLCGTKGVSFEYLKGVSFEYLSEEQSCLVAHALN